MTAGTSSGGSDNGDEVPSHYGTPLIMVGMETDRLMKPINWAGDRPETYVHLKDGRFFGFYLDEQGRYVYRGNPEDLMEALPAAAPKAIEQ